MLKKVGKRKENLLGKIKNKKMIGRGQVELILYSEFCLRVLDKYFLEDHKLLKCGALGHFFY